MPQNRKLISFDWATKKILRSKANFEILEGFLSILYFDFGDGDDYIYKGTTNFRGVHNNSILQLNKKQKELYNTSKVEKLFPEFYLLKIKNFNDIAKDTLDEWINFLKNETIPNNPKAKGLEKAKGLKSEI